MLHIDVYEPAEIEYLMKQSVPVFRNTLNASGIADYFWQDVNGFTIQVERKQWREILGNFDHIEEQLRREIPSCDSTYLLIEGIAVPTEYGVDVFKHGGKGYCHLIWHSGEEDKPQPLMYHRLHSFLWQLDKHGISVVQTSSQLGTAMALVAMYKQSQRTGTQMFQRYIREKPHLPDLSNHVLTLMSVAGVELGQKRAEALINKFGTVWNVLNQSVESLCTVEGVGKTTATKLLEAIGK